jgi:hypothetical protein
MIPWMFRTISLLLALTLVGCGGGARTSPVEGVVLLDGKPLADASIQFVPQDKGRDATGQTDKSGQFSMSTYEPRDGVLPGTYKVVVSPPTGVADTAQYGSADDAMAATAKTQAKKASGPPFPQQYSRADQTPLTQEIPAKGKLTLELKSN